MVAVVVATHLIYVICNGVGQAVTYDPVTASKLGRSDLRKSNYAERLIQGAIKPHLLQIFCRYNLMQVAEHLFTC